VIGGHVFSVSERDRICDRVLQFAASDARVVAGAVVGSLARDEGDRWSDLDLTFAVADNVSILDVLEDWTRKLAELPSTGSSCCPAVFNSTCHSRPHPSLAPMARSLG
jgi:predicted nucleotidyltransferase